MTESANSGALSDDQIAANQLQVDSSLDALNRIAQTTSFQGRRLSTGALTSSPPPAQTLATSRDLSIDQANLGATGTVPITVSVTTAATRAQVDITNIAAGVAGTAFQSTLDFVDSQVDASGDTSAAGFTDGTVAGTLDLLAASPAHAGANGNNLTIEFAENGAVATHSAAIAGDVLTITVGTNGAGATIALDTIFQGLSGEADFTDNFTYTAADVSGDYTVTTDAGSATITFSGGADGGTDTITIDAGTAGTAANTTFALAGGDASAGNNNVLVTGDVASGFTVTIQTGQTVATSTIESELDAFFTANSLDYTASSTSTGSPDGNYIEGTDAAPAVTTTNGTGATGGISDDVVIELSGTDATDVFEFAAGTTIDALEQAIDLVSDATGVEATVNGTTLELTSTGYGSNAIVDIKVLSEGTGGGGGTFDTAVGLRTRAEGTNVDATVNGIAVDADGNSFSINTATLDLNAAVAAGITGDISFDITGGGALFQLGPDVVSNQQARIGIRSVNTARLGGVTGKLYQLGKGGTASLTADLRAAAKIIGEAVDQVTSLRGRLGAFQKTTLETNIAALNDTLVNLTDAESQIRDADFAVETANLTRAQILVQSGTSVLAIANSNPQNVLALLR